MPDPSAPRDAALAMDPDEFRELGHALVDHLGAFLEDLPRRRVAPGKAPAEVRSLLPAGGLPEEGADPAPLLLETLALLQDNLAFNGHPRFLAYITASPAPIGMLADFAVSALNPNCGLWQLTPLATEIELQTVRWLADFLGLPPGTGGVMSSGGQAANHVGLLLARRDKAPWDVRALGSTDGSGRRLRVYASTETHGWLNAAADLFGLGKEAVRWIPTTADGAMDVAALERAVADDAAAGDVPMAVVGTAGSVGTGAVDPLPAIGELCRQRNVWFHVDGAYGAPAVVLPDAPADLVGLRDADSVAVDPHKWLYAPIDAGCTLVRDPALLDATFGARPDYYAMGDGGDAPLNLYGVGPENSRRFRALKVWLALRQVGRRGYARMIGDDVALARRLHDQAAAHPELEARTLGLSIVTFRYVPADLAGAGAGVEAYLDRLNRELLARLVAAGELFVSNAVVAGTFLLRACVVNFRTTEADIDAVPGIVARAGAECDRALRPGGLGPDSDVPVA